MTTTLTAVLATSDMLEIDGLHAFEFTLEDEQLLIIAMDGRAQKRWSFSLEQLQAAAFDETSNSWTLTGDVGEHRLSCVNAFTGNNHDEDEADADA